MSHNSKIIIPASALLELDQVEASDCSISAQELVDWVNHIVERFLPDDGEAASGRVSQALGLRSMRHYQTLGCIDAPFKKGREARYGFRHYLQALLVRKLIWERVPSEQIVRMLQGRSTAEYKELLLDGIEIVAQSGKFKSNTDSAFINSPQAWLRIPLALGIEVHLNKEITSLKNSDLPALERTFESVIRTHLLSKRKQSKS
jgi:hypothetical protein